MKNQSTYIRMVAICKAKPSHLNEVQVILEKFVEVTRTEAGCLSYQLHADLDDPAQFLFYEIWKDQEALGEHFERQPIKELIKRLEPLLAIPPTLFRLKVIDRNFINPET